MFSLELDQVSKFGFKVETSLIEVLDTGRVRRQLPDQSATEQQSLTKAEGDLAIHGRVDVDREEALHVRGERDEVRGDHVADWDRVVEFVIGTHATPTLIEFPRSDDRMFEIRCGRPLALARRGHLGRVPTGQSGNTVDPVAIVCQFPTHHVVRNGRVDFVS